ncbi:MAG: Yip1 family protein [Nitrospirota bacterium]
MQIFLQRVIRAAKLERGLYEEVEADQTAAWQAMGVVILSGLAAGLGTMGQFGGSGRIIGGLFAAIAGWFVWAAMTYWIGTRILPEPQTRADFGELLRTTGFASAPGLLRVFGIVPGITGYVFAAASLWMLIAMVIAVRQALDYRSTGRAVAVCAIGWLIQLIILALTIRAAATDAG